MAEEDEGRAADLEKKAREQNSNLKRLIDTVGGLISSSRELLSKLHGGPQDKAPPADEHPGQAKDPPAGQTRPKE